MGVILKPYGRKFHLKFVDGTEKTYDASELEFYNFKAKMAKGGGVHNDVWEKYQIQDKHGYVSYFDDKENALKFLKDNEGSFAIRWDDTEQPIMAKGGYLIDIINTDGVPNILANGGGVDEDEIEKSAIFYTDESRWSTKPSISDFESKIQADKESLRKLENKEITPSKIVGGGYKSSAAAKKVATQYLQNRILVNQRAIEILKNRGEVMAAGGNVGDVTKAEIAKMQKISARQLQAYLPSVKYVYYDKETGKYYFDTPDGNYYELKSEYTLDKLSEHLKNKSGNIKPKMEQGGNLPETYSLIKKWSDNMVTDADIDSVIEAMIKAKITDADLVTPPTKTGTQFTKAKEKLNNEIFKKVEQVYVGNLKGNQPYSIISTMVDYATRFGDKTIAEYKKQNTHTKSGWKHKKTTKA
jgi:uncharacterized protein with FMN-binding domain